MKRLVGIVGALIIVALFLPLLRGYGQEPQQSNTSTLEVVEKEKADLSSKNNGITIREQLNIATGYWYASIREKVLGDGQALRNVRQEGEWTVAEVFGHHGFTPLRVLTRFLDAEETRIGGGGTVLGNMKSRLHFSSSEQGKQWAIDALNILTAGALKTKEECLRWIEENKDFVIWDDNAGVFRVDEERKAKNLAPSIRELRLSLQADKTSYSQDDPIVLTFKLENVSPPSGVLYSLLWVNRRMLIHSEIVVEVRNEKDEYLHFLPPAPPPPLTAKDFQLLDGGKFVEAQEEITSSLSKKPLKPGRYTIQAEYRNYELGKNFNLQSPIPHLLEDGPAWVGKLFSNTVMIEVKELSTDQISCESQGGNWGRFGLLQKEQCNLPTSDAGKECFDHSACKSVCVADDSVLAGDKVTGKCYGWTITLGTCLNYVKDGKAQGIICED